SAPVTDVHTVDRHLLDPAARPPHSQLDLPDYCPDPRASYDTFVRSVGPPRRPGLASEALGCANAAHVRVLVRPTMRVDRTSHCRQRRLAAILRQHLVIGGRPDEIDPAARRVRADPWIVS